MKQFIQRGLLVSDFNLENLSGYLTNDAGQPQIQCNVAPFGQVMQTLLDGTLPCWAPAPDFVVAWTRPEAVLNSFSRLLQGISIKEKELLDEVDDYAKAIARAGKLSKTLLVPTWTVPLTHAGPARDLSKDVGISRLIMQANLRLLESLDGLPNVVPLNASRWMEQAGENAFNERLWYSGKIPFGNQVFKAAARQIKAALRGIRGMAKKLVVLDLDDTLWGGVVGEVGWQNVILGGTDPFGEAFADFQRSLRLLKNRGVVLAVASKNEEPIALQAINQHPEMLLRQDEFAAWRINWKDKAQNIIEIARELNLGLDSIVFIDNSDVERDRVRQALPEVLVPEWPSDPRLYVRALRNLDCFEQPTVTHEDRRRAEMYVEERERAASKAQAGSLEEWLKSLDVTVKVEPVGPSNLGRTAQLLNKTNQMNLTTRRMTEQEFRAWSLEPGHHSWVFSVSDRFGDSGLTGLLSLEGDKDGARLIDFVLSCRVMGRKVEETMLHWAVEAAASHGIAQLTAVYLPTPKNAPCLAFFQHSGFAREEAGSFSFDVLDGYPLPDGVRLIPPAGSDLPGPYSPVTVEAPVLS